MKRERRLEKMNAVKILAKTADQRGDVVARQQASETWLGLATPGEENRAPRYLTWVGRG
jgi:hypothetical protein